MGMTLASLSGMLNIRARHPYLFVHRGTFKPATLELTSQDADWKVVSILTQLQNASKGVKPTMNALLSLLHVHRKNFGNGFPAPCTMPLFPPVRMVTRFFANLCTLHQLELSVLKPRSI